MISNKELILFDVSLYFSICFVFCANLFQVSRILWTSFIFYCKNLLKALFFKKFPFMCSNFSLSIVFTSKILLFFSKVYMTDNIFLDRLMFLYFKQSFLFYKKGLMILLTKFLSLYYFFILNKISNKYLFRISCIFDLLTLVNHRLT